MDISESIGKDDFEKARDAVITLIKKVRTSLKKKKMSVVFLGEQTNVTKTFEEYSCLK